MPRIFGWKAADVRRRCARRARRSPHAMLALAAVIPAVPQTSGNAPTANV
mgnify:CR=1 FL=1